MSEKPFLTARWSPLAMLNYLVDPGILMPYVPVGTELDSFESRSFVSMVGLLFHDARVWGMSIPWHRHFPEVNLRFYVRRYIDGEWRRGVVFIKEIVPRRTVSFVARSLYEEKFVRLPVRNTVEPRVNDPNTPGHVEFQWRFANAWHRLARVT